MAFQVEFHPDAVRDFEALDGSIQREIARRIDALSANPFIGKPLGNKLGMNLSGFYKLYASRKKYRIVYHILEDRLEVVEVVGIGKREKAEIYHMVFKRIRGIQEP